ncbi:MFS transporter, ACS family, pantothenate transporter [Geosmithia morbida]|uniref:MFS transporter, ACS family, pantothenate transporter n=1 Tax=Geosmithia morbida TaxID=1094350 RepID=A0A9P4YM30_9HYPO|nr:MFS transporter, ACS family, pantothenate transporter [Geosmithia morbida]KAF4119483.1 MFS transporter, ACS family, pantothenate transporter [Geosmithia morbida]
MTLSFSFFLKHVFSSFYGKDRPKFFLWCPEGTTSSEKWLLFKIDFFILTYGCLAYFTKWLDQANLSNAYVSGMREDLKMFGTEYNLATTCFSLYPLRFFVGFLEGSCFVGIQFVLGSWYKRSEIGKRTAVFSCAAYVGSMVSGYLQSAVLAGLDGKNGLVAWRWVFIIDGIITVIVAIFGFIFFPDTPYNTKAFYLSDEDKKRSIQRLVEDGREETTRFTWDLFLRTIKSRHLYMLTILWMFWNTTVGKVANTVMQLYLKTDTTRHWSLYDVNNIPTSINGWNIVLSMALNIYVDATGYRMAAIVFNLCILLFGTICLVIWDIPLGLRIVSYMFAGSDGPLSPLYYSWANILTSGDTQVRALTLAIMNSCGAALTTVIQQFLYPVTDAPQFGKGFKASLGFICGMCIWVLLLRYFELQELERLDEMEETEYEQQEEKI